MDLVQKRGDRREGASHGWCVGDGMVAYVTFDAELAVTCQTTWSCWLFGRFFQVVFQKKKKIHIISFNAMWPHGCGKINKTLLWNVPTSNNMKRWPLCPWTKGEGFQVGLVNEKVSRLWEGSAPSNPRIVISSSFSLRIIDTIFKAFASHGVYPNLVMKISLVVVLPPFGKEFAQP